METRLIESSFLSATVKLLTTHVLLRRKPRDMWARYNQEMATLYVEHLERICQPDDIYDEDKTYSLNRCLDIVMIETTP